MTKQPAYYSAEMDKLYGHVYYEDENGNEVKVTSVGLKPKYPDTIEVSYVVRYLRGDLDIYRYDPTRPSSEFWMDRMLGPSTELDINRLHIQSQPEFINLNLILDNNKPFITKENEND